MPELLLSCQDLTKAFGAAPLFEGLSLGLFAGDHVGLVGPNGSGKSTLLRILAGLEEPSSGTRAARKRLRIGYVPQDPAFEPAATVASVLAGGFAGAGRDDHEVEAQVGVWMGKAGFAEASQSVDALSGGWRKRLAILRAIVAEPELLLLDEPTNHLDVDGIVWLEELLQGEPEAFLAVSHDRYFLESVATRVIELNRAFASGVLDVRGRYSDHLQTKDDMLASQASYQESLRNKVRGEIVWLSRKAKARTRKGRARVDEAHRLQEELSDLERRPKRLLVVDGATKAFGGSSVIAGLDLVLRRGMRLGLLGANGAGKSTLLRLIAGIETPDAGTVERAPNLRVVTFDQHRSDLDPAASLRRTLAPAGDSVVVAGRAVHVAGWARRFLFRPEQLDTPVGRLSGGEQARALVARLMLEPADLLLLDEPTNDLDIPTLDALEESLLEFPGALVLVTHDRYLLDRVSNQILALDGRGGGVFFSDYTQWEASVRAARERQASASRRPSAEGPRRAVGERTRRLGYREQREWDQMEARILDAEARLDTCRRAADDPAVVSDHQALAERLHALAATQAEVDSLYARWAELEAKGSPTPPVE
jgi:ABC transport system ATP-binding/permease protein